MLRLAFLSVLMALALPAQAQLFGQGPPASVTSPTADGRTHGVPASVVSPNPPPFLPGRSPLVVSSRTLRPFGTAHHRHIFIPVPLFYPVYASGYDPGLSIADPSVQAADPPSAPTAAPSQSAETSDSGVASSEDALRQAYIQGVRDALSQQPPDSRYGQHYMDSRENASRGSAPASGETASRESLHPKPQSKPAAVTEPDLAADDSPATVFIFKDGHQFETRNYAIMGQTLYDFSATSLKKVQLSDLDAAATVKANDDRGITVKLQ
jgi:hypothetical protein